MGPLIGHCPRPRPSLPEIDRAVHRELRPITSPLLSTVPMFAPTFPRCHPTATVLPIPPSHPSPNNRALVIPSLCHSCSRATSSTHMALSLLSLRLPPPLPPHVQSHRRRSSPCLGCCTLSLAANGTMSRPSTASTGTRLVTRKGTSRKEDSKSADQIPLWPLPSGTTFSSSHLINSRRHLQSFFNSSHSDSTRHQRPSWF